MVVGDPGVGKSTVTLDIIANAERTGSKVLFISAEMSPVDLKLYVDRYPKFGDLDIFFPQEIADDESPKAILEEVLNEGYDIVLIDSFIELQATIQESDRMTRNRAEKWLLDLMYQQNLGQNKGKNYTSFLNIQQVNKGGTFVGSNKLKHMTTGMMEIRFVDTLSQDERYVVFSKNRRGHVGKQMFFNLAATGDVTYDTERFKKSESLKQLKKKEKEMVKKDGLEFDKLFGLKDEVTTE
jgi:DNA repair protein RadA/Sms